MEWDIDVATIVYLIICVREIHNVCFTTAKCFRKTNDEALCKYSEIQKMDWMN